MRRSDMLFLIVTTRASELSEFTNVLVSAAGEVFPVESALAALDMAASLESDFVIVDETMRGGPPLAFVGELLKVNARLTTAVISSLSEEKFHEESEGLGVLAQIPFAPTKRDGEQLLEKLRCLSSR